MLKSIYLCSALVLVINFSLIGRQQAHADDTGLANRLHSLKYEKGKLCQDGHFHTSKGTGGTKALALKAARRSWMAFTTMEYGTDWGSYAKAASKIEHCSRDAGEDSCTVVARPCKGSAARKRRYVRRHHRRLLGRKRIH